MKMPWNEKENAQISAKLRWGRKKNSVVNAMKKMVEKCQLFKRRKIKRLTQHQRPFSNE